MRSRNRLSLGPVDGGSGGRIPPSPIFATATASAHATCTRPWSSELPCAPVRRSRAESVDVRQPSRRRSPDKMSGKDRALRNQHFGCPWSERLGEQEALRVAATHVSQLP